MEKIGDNVREQPYCNYCNCISACMEMVRTAASMMQNVFNSWKRQDNKASSNQSQVDQLEQPSVSDCHVVGHVEPKGEPRSVESTSQNISTISDFCQNFVLWGCLAPQDFKVDDDCPFPTGSRYHPAPGHRGTPMMTSTDSDLLRYDQNSELGRHSTSYSRAVLPRDRIDH